MKRKLSLLSLILITVLLGFETQKCFAQGASINATGASADNSAILDVSSTTQGQLMPRMTTTERDAIVSPAQSLMIYNTTTKCLQLFEGGFWQSVFCACLPPASPAAGTNVPTAYQIVWNWITVSGATAYYYNTVNDFATATTNLTSTTYTQTGLTPGTAYTLYVWALNSCNHSIAPTTLTATTPAWACGATMVVIHTAGLVAPVNKTVSYGTVATSIGGSGSKCWITQNLGATNQATSATDATETSAGWYWQFNLMQGYKHDGSTRTPNTTWITPISETSDWVAANDPCTILLGAGWRLPTNAEWTAADGAPQNWASYTNTYASVLKLHAAGNLVNSSGSIASRGSGGNYWSSTQGSTTTGGVLNFTNSTSIVSNLLKNYGFTVRCLKD